MLSRRHGAVAPLAAGLQLNILVPERCGSRRCSRFLPSTRFFLRAREARGRNSEGPLLARKAVVRVMSGYGTTAPEYTCVSLRERTSAHFVRLRTPDLRLTFVLD